MHWSSKLCLWITVINTWLIGLVVGAKAGAIYIIENKMGATVADETYAPIALDLVLFLIQAACLGYMVHSTKIQEQKRKPIIPLLISIVCILIFAINPSG